MNIGWNEGYGKVKFYTRMTGVCLWESQKLTYLLTGISTSAVQLCDLCTQQLKCMDPVTGTTTFQSAWVCYYGCCVMSRVSCGDSRWVPLSAPHAATNCVHFIKTCVSFHKELWGNEGVGISYNKWIRDVLCDAHTIDIRMFIQKHFYFGYLHQVTCFHAV
jgi:hypothetical protein